MKLAAAKGIAEAVTEEDLSEDYIIPSVFNREVGAESGAGGRRGGQARRPRSLQRGDRHLLDGGGPAPLVKVLVTGASGFIGQALCDALLVRGEEVVGLTRDPERVRRSNPLVDWHAWEPTLERPPASLRGCRGRRKPARREGQPGAGPTTPSVGSSESRRTGPTTWGRRSPRWSPSPRCWSASLRSVTTATAARRSSMSPPSPATASTPRWCGSGRRRRGRSRAAACALSWSAQGTCSTPAAALLAQLLTPFKLGVGGPIAGGKQYMSWVHIDDEVGVLLWALNEEKVSAPSTPRRPTRSPTKSCQRPWGAPSAARPWSPSRDSPST